MSEHELRVALDIGSKKHRVGIATDDGRIVEEFDITHDKAGFELFFKRVEARRDGLPVVVALNRPQMLASIAALVADVVVIDTPANAEAMTAGVVRVAHLALVAIQLSGADIWASAAAVKLIQQKIDLGGQLDQAAAGTMCQPDFIETHARRRHLHREFVHDAQAGGLCS